ncbi:MAG: winged helix-turn-helix domain-containing protein [Alphaproteobacteria bacterium]
MRPTGDGPVFRFDRFVLDLERGTVRGAGGEEIVLRPKAFALLSHLVQRPGRLHRREELLEALWPDVIVTDDSLTQCVSDLRRALGDRAAHVLRTLPRRGYVLVAEVQRGNAVAPLPSAPAPLPPPAPAPAAPRPPPPAADPEFGRRDAVFVQPLEAAEDDPACVRLARVLTTALVAELVRFEDLRVVTAPDERPGGYRVLGEVYGADGRLHVAIRLEDAGDGAAIWAERLDFPAGDAVRLPVGPTVGLAASIDLQIGRESLRRARRKSPALRSARELCLLGRELHQRGTEADTRAAQELFVGAVVADPGYAPGHAWHAFTVMRTVTHGWGVGDGQAERAQAVRIARRAVEIEPDSPLCLSALAFALALRESWDEAVVTARAALRSGRPADYGTRTACGEVLAGAGHPEEAVEAVRQALAIDPHCPPRTRAVLGRALLLAGRPEEALVELHRSAAYLPDYAPCFRSIVVAAVEVGRLDEAAAALREVARLQPNWVPGDQPVRWFLRHPSDVARFLAAFHAAGAPHGEPASPVGEGAAMPGAPDVAAPARPAPIRPALRPATTGPTPRRRPGGRG